MKLFKALAQDDAFYRRSGIRSGGPAPRSSCSFAFGLVLALAAGQAFSWSRIGAGARFPALGSADLSRRPELGLVVQSRHRTTATLDGGARHPFRARQNSRRSSPGNVGADYRQCLRGASLSSRSPCSRAPSHFLATSMRRPRSTAPPLCSASCRSRCPSLRRRFAITPFAQNRLDRQFRRSHHRHDQWRPGRPDPNRRELYLHPGLPAARFRLRLGDRARSCWRCCLLYSMLIVVIRQRMIEKGLIT